MAALSYILVATPAHVRTVCGFLCEGSLILEVLGSSSSGGDHQEPSWPLKGEAGL